MARNVNYFGGLGNVTRTLSVSWLPARSTSRTSTADLPLPTATAHGAGCGFRRRTATPSTASAPTSGAGRRSRRSWSGSGTWPWGSGSASGSSTNSAFPLPLHVVVSLRTRGTITVTIGDVSMTENVNLLGIVQVRNGEILWARIGVPLGWPFQIPAPAAFHEELSTDAFRGWTSSPHCES